MGMPEMTPTQTAAVEMARENHAKGVALQGEAAGMLRVVARQLRDAGWKQTDIAAALNVNRQRVGQLLAATRMPD